MNPYSQTSFFSFISLFLKRIPLLISGNSSLAADELQLFILLAIAVSSAILGTFLVLRRMAMLANALSHTILLGIVFAFWISQKGVEEAHHHDPTALAYTPLLLGCFLTALLTTFITQLLTHSLHLQAEASCGLTFTTLFACGIILVTLLTRNAHIGTELVFGNIDAVQNSDLYFVIWSMLGNIFITCLLYKEYVLTSFDRGYAHTLGISNAVFDYLLMAQTSLSLITSFRAVGVLMVLALLTAPVLTARLLCTRLFSTIITAVAISSFCCVFGVALSRHLLTVYGMALSTSGIIVCLMAFLFLTLALVKTWVVQTAFFRGFLRGVRP